MSPICGQCGKEMAYLLIAPCIDCGGNPREIDEFNNRSHIYYSCSLFYQSIFCDFCINDLESTDPEFWGFPPEFDWNGEDVSWDTKVYEEANLTMG